MEMLKGEGTDAISGVIEKQLAGGSSLAAIIESEYDPDTLEALYSIARCAYHDAPPKRPIHRMLAGLISSAGDVDKLSYLVADSHFTGVAYGRGIDVWGYFRTLRVPEEVLDREEGTGPILAIDERGLRAIESIIAARFSMLGRVYWHDRNRAIMAVFKQAVYHLFANEQNEKRIRFSEYFRDTFWMTAPEAIQYLAARLQASGYENRLDGLDRGRRELCSELAAFAPSDKPELHALLGREQDNGGHPGGVTARELGKVAKLRIEEATGLALASDTVIVDLPNRARDQLKMSEILVVRTRGGGSQRGDARDEAFAPVDRVSATIERMGAQYLNEAKRARVFVLASEYRRLEEADVVAQAEQAVGAAFDEFSKTS
jgi:hypothetical protein